MPQRSSMKWNQSNCNRFYHREEFAFGSHDRIEGDFFCAKSHILIIMGQAAFCGSILSVNANRLVSRADNDVDPITIRPYI